MDREQFNRLEEGFAHLIAALRGIFTAQELGYVEEFLNVREYALALETAIDIFREENKHISPTTGAILKSLALRMNIQISSDLSLLCHAREHS